MLRVISGAYIVIILSLLLIPVKQVNAKTSISFNEAIRIALSRDALIKTYSAQSNAYLEASVAEDTLPDPKVKLGVMNLPTDTYARDQEPMTQVLIGVQQMFPRGDSLHIKSQRAMQMSDIEQARVELQKRKVKRAVSQLWLEHYYWLKAKEVVKKNKVYFKELVLISKQQYAAGRQKQQDVLRSELELGMLDDREEKIQTMIDITGSKLAKYIGTEYQEITVQDELPEIQFEVNNDAWIDNHPEIRIENAKITVNKSNLELSKQSYKPSWMLDLSYGIREGNNMDGSERANFVSAMVMFDLPLFTGDRQDRQVAASKYKLNSARDNQEEKKRNLINMWQENNATLNRLADRIKRYQKLLIPKSKENSEAALYAYQSGRGSFTALARAQITELETQLSSLRLKIDLVKAQTQKIFLTANQ